jgi:hypothetical protein
MVFECKYWTLTVIGYYGLPIGKLVKTMIFNIYQENTINSKY